MTIQIQSILEFGADPHVEGIYEGEDSQGNKKEMQLRQVLKLVDCPIRHLGTEKAQQLYCNIQEWLLSAWC